MKITQLAIIGHKPGIFCQKEQLLNLKIISQFHLSEVIGKV